MSIALPGSWGLFSHLQLALPHAQSGSIHLDHGVHDALNDFRWLRNNLFKRLTHL
jgi:hypothetical protein